MHADEKREGYPPKMVYEWHRPPELVPSAFKKLQEHYAQFPQITLKEILLLNGHPEEVTLTAFVLNFAHHLLLHESPDFPRLEGVVRETYPTLQRQSPTAVSPCNFEIGKLSEHDEQMLIFSKLKNAPEEIYEEARDKLIIAANQLLASMNRNTIPNLK